jgi:hypothetical protein
LYWCNGFLKKPSRGDRQDTQERKAGACLFSLFAPFFFTRSMRPLRDTLFHSLTVNLFFNGINDNFSIGWKSKANIS